MNRFIVLFLSIGLYSAASMADDVSESCSGVQADAILGQKVEDLRGAFNDPLQENFLERLQKLGNDSRYYVMVRGWLVQHIEMTQSYQSTRRYQDSAEYRQRIDAILQRYKKGLRLLDLE